MRKGTVAKTFEPPSQTTDEPRAQESPAAANLDKFREFCATLRIQTKERGTISLSPENWTGTQRYFVEEIERGLADGIHTFIVLKGRQVMITTICLALDLYFLFKHSGLSGSIVAHDEETRDMIKATLEMYIDSLPREFKIPTPIHNRNQLVCKNTSRIAYQVAGTRKNTNLGRGKGLTFLHATEVSSWGDEEGLASLIASLAQHNPVRFFVYESTAKGFNMWSDMWDRAKESVTQRAIFVGWWRNAYYACKVESRQFQVYVGETADALRLTPEEKGWVKEVKNRYDFDITAEQIAWWRWQLEEEIGDLDMMYQEFPPTEEYAFIASGENFFSTARLSDEMKRIKKLPKGEMYRFVLRENFEDCDLIESPHKQCNLTVWEAPSAEGRYVIGADPAYGSSDWADRFVASVWRCYGDGMVQAAEFCTKDCTPYQFAWVILYLAGAYTKADVGTKSRVQLNLEINGPGQAVFQELIAIRRIAAATPKSSVSQKILMVARNLDQYLYRRIDSFGRPNAYHWKSTRDEKERMLNFFKDCFERGISEVNSTALLEEMQRFKRTDDGELSADGGGSVHKDDRVIGAGLAHVAWSDSVRMQCIQAKLVKPKYDETGKQVDEFTHGRMAISSQMKGVLARIGVKV